MFNDVTQPFFWLHIIQMVGADQRVQHRRVFTTTIGIREQSVLPAHRHTLYSVFGDVVVDVHPAITEVHIPRIPLFQQVRKSPGRI